MDFYKSTYEEIHIIKTKTPTFLQEKEKIFFIGSYFIVAPDTFVDIESRNASISSAEEKLK